MKTKVISLLILVLISFLSGCKCYRCDECNDCEEEEPNPCTSFENASAVINLNDLSVECENGEDCFAVFTDRINIIQHIYRDQPELIGSTIDGVSGPNPTNVCLDDPLYTGISAPVGSSSYSCQEPPNDGEGDGSFFSMTFLRNDTSITVPPVPPRSQTLDRVQSIRCEQTGDFNLGETREEILFMYCENEPLTHENFIGITLFDLNSPISSSYPTFTELKNHYLNIKDLCSGYSTFVVDCTDPSIDPLKCSLGIPADKDYFTVFHPEIDFFVTMVQTNDPSKVLRVSYSTPELLNDKINFE